ncbi:MAG: hypothetical protein BWY21_01905 [Parcubacteria group bacterium ADurb.Bin216]|nr:MAG: hypothetical protein BWY21_01905 [Parcubacteria group bacterium ADurb.Bin216]
MEDSKVISTCALTKEQIGTSQTSVFQLVTQTSYATVNTCTGERVGQFNQPEFTAFSAILIFIVCLVVFFGLMKAVFSY